MFKPRALALSVTAVAFIAAGRQARATTITFDGSISNLGGTTSVLPLGIDYLPTGLGSITLTTQGYDFGGIGSRPDGTDGSPDLFVLYDPTKCSAAPPVGVGTSQACASDGTKYVVQDFGFSLTKSGGGLFALNSFDASGPFGPGGCPDVCSGGAVQPDATQVEVKGYRSGALVADQIFSGIIFGFATFTPNNDPDWADIDRAVFQPLRDPTGLRTGLAIDNVTVNAVPEPATLTLTAIGLAGVLRARRRRRP